MDFIALSGSVFSAAFGFHSRVTSLSFARASGSENELRILSVLEKIVATMVLFDAASNDDSNGGQFIIWSNLDLCCEIPAVELNLAVLGGK